jgi:hypothetical protein
LAVPSPVEEWWWWWWRECDGKRYPWANYHIHPVGWKINGHRPVDTKERGQNEINSKNKISANQEEQEA